MDPNAQGQTVQQQQQTQQPTVIAQVPSPTQVVQYEDPNITPTHQPVQKPLAQPVPQQMPPAVVPQQSAVPVVTPPSPPQVPQVSLSQSSSSKGSKKKLFLFIGIVIAVFLLLGIATIFMKSQSVQVLPSDKEASASASASDSIDNPLPTVVPIGEPLIHDYVAFVVGNSAGNMSTVKIYDLESSTEIPIGDQISSYGYTDIAIGSWSPGGHRLPIYVEKTGDVSERLVYLFNAETETVGAIYKSTDGSANVGKSTIALSTWEDDNRLKISEQINDEARNIDRRYLMITGQITQTLFPIQYMIGNRALQITTQKEITSEIKQVATISYKQKKYKYKFGENIRGELVGAFDKYIIMLDHAPVLIDKQQRNNEALVVDPEATTGATTRSQPSSFITIIDITDKEEPRTFPMGEDGWLTVDVHAIASQNVLIVHQTERLRPPFKERFLMLDVVTGRTRLLFSNESEYGSTFLTDKVADTFVPTESGTWIVMYENLAGQDSDNRMIVARNLKTRERKVLCDNYCSSLRVYNSSILIKH